jgi:hypothetical protein
VKFGATQRLVSLDKLVLSGGDWFSNRLMSMNICKRLVYLYKLDINGGSWCLSRLVSMNISKTLVSLDKLVLNDGYWCLQRFVRVGWFLPGFVAVGIDVFNRSVPTHICNSRLVPTQNYKDKFYGFLPKGFPRKSCVPCYAIDRSYMCLFSYG